MNKEIGGYIEFEHYHGEQYHNNAIKLNCSRNALAYLIKLHEIKKIYIPFFLCDSVRNVCSRYEVECKFYNIDENFFPILPEIDFSHNWLYVVNYYGQLQNEKIKELYSITNNLIIDNVQAFFQKPILHIPTIYNCRKYFGVTDGAYLYSDNELPEKLEKDFSYRRMEFLFGRFEKNASEFYSLYTANNKLFKEEPIKKMSSLTENIMSSLDYNNIKKTRTENFLYLYNKFNGINKLKLSICEGAFAYPLLVENGSEIRKRLQTEKIYIPTLWPDVFDVCEQNCLEWQYAENILPLPVDQRYGIEEMKYIYLNIYNILGGK